MRSRISLAPRRPVTEGGRPPAVPPEYVPRENDGWLDLEAQLQEEVNEREDEEGRSGD